MNIIIESDGKLLVQFVDTILAVFYTDFLFRGYITPPALTLIASSMLKIIVKLHYFNFSHR
jgi:hypothetical protein